MERSSGRRSPLRVVLLVSLSILSLMLATATSAGSFTELVVFGESLSDTGNLFAATGGAIPPSPPYFEGRFSNGPIWVDYLASALDLSVDDFAVSGALTGRTNRFDDPSIPVEFPGLLDEIDAFVGLNPAGGDRHTLYAVWAGADDFRASPSPATILPAVQNLAHAVDTLTRHGARHILVFNMPDLGLTPAGVASGFSTELTALSIAFNHALKSTLKGRGHHVIVVDIFDLVNDIVADPSKYDLTDVSTPCLDLVTFSVCADPDEHLFWDPLHPTTRGHKILADRLQDLVARGHHRKNHDK